MAHVTLGGTPSNTSGDLPAVGSQAPDFKFVKTDLSESSLSAYQGKKVILNIFPSVDTDTCATSVRKFNQKAASLENTAILCISEDLPFAQKRFCGAEGIDAVEAVSVFKKGNDFGSSYGIGLIDGPFNGLLSRGIVVLDENGVVKHTEIVPEVANEPDYESALAAL
ncbi:tpx [Symbiodinium sp. KB8]|nr:tpx [Symbiodinium sp. KB8]